MSSNFLPLTCRSFSQSLDRGVPQERFAGRLPPCSGGKGSLEAKVTLGKAWVCGELPHSMQRWAFGLDGSR